MEKTFETIVIGAGSAGLTVGMFLQDCIIFDKKSEIGKPVQCGEGLAKKHLEILGISPLKEWISVTTEKTEIICPNKKIVNIFGTVYVLEKDKFEKFLASKAKCEIILENEVLDFERKGDFWEVKTKKGVFKSKYLIGADGPFSLVRRKIFGEKVEFFPCLEFFMETEKEIDTSSLKIYLDFERFKLGYAWIFPKSKNTANIGLGGKFELKKEFDRFLENEVKEVCGKVKFIQSKSGVVPIGGAKISLFKENAFLVGDAGALADPIFGGGIGSAMVSAKIAAKLILENRAKDYEKEIKSIPVFSLDFLKASKIFYSFDNEILNEVAEVLEKKKVDLFYLKKHFPFFEFVKKPNIRKNIQKFLKLYLMYKKYEGRESYLG